MLKVGQVWRGVRRSSFRNFASVDDNGNFIFCGDVPTDMAVIDVMVKSLPDPRFQNLVIVEAIDIGLTDGKLQYWEEVERVVAGKLDP